MKRVILVIRMILVILGLVVAVAAQSKSPAHGGENFAADVKVPAIVLEPRVSPEQKISLRDAQYKRDQIQKQLDNLNLQLAQIQSAAQAQFAKLNKEQADANAALEAVVKQITTGVDEKKWTLDQDAAAWKANAPPVEQAKK